ncbi:MAG TPA: glycoside hydrolase family 38 C-terminal domain-containing protein [Ktedonobacteraceae bacterium]|jgi:alpha-mannosidase|nr:glycoside hydrolase family 38 C-terminal domain-containing protein [Ktedonobacteraceae bacterium]
MAQQLNIIIVPHTHWDREWYQTFQQFRFRLVQTIDSLLDILDNDPGFTHFLLDGQTVVLEDYLEVQPEQEERLKKYTRCGRIQVGPWYIQPDEFLVSGESLVRNLQRGLQQASEFGEPMRVGYVPDCFGHIAQLPQILQGFGIDNAVFWRGVGAEAEKSEFYWTAPDGTRVLVIHLADALGYSNARQMPLNVDEFITRVELLAAPLLSKATTDTLLFMNGSDHLMPQRGLPEVIASVNRLLAHLEPEHRQLLAKYAHPRKNAGVPQYDSIQIQIGTLPQYVEVVRKQAGHPDAEPLQTLSGDMRSSQFSHLLPSVLSTRMWIKQQNALTEHLLEHAVEPLTAWASQLGAPYPSGLVKLAWKFLLQNHPHDSICGCSIDQVHAENRVRFAQSQQISSSLVGQAIERIMSQIDTRAPFPSPQTGHDLEPIPIVVFNPAPGPRSEKARVVIQFPGSLADAAIVDERGRQMPFAIIDRWTQDLGSMSLPRETLAAALAVEGTEAAGELVHKAESMVTSLLGQPENSYVISRIHLEMGKQPRMASVEVMITPRGRVTVDEQALIKAERDLLALIQGEDIDILEASLIDEARETIEFVAADLPAFGFKTFWVYPRGLQNDRPEASTSLMVSQQQACIENEFYNVVASRDNGTLTITDKQTGAVFAGLNRFVDGGDVGDLYNYSPPAQDLLISEPIDPPEIDVINSGGMQATLRIRGTWLLPASCSPDRSERSSNMIECPIVSEVSLIAGVRRIAIHTRIDNRARDHRLRVVFPVSYTVEHVAAESTFEVRMRPVAAPHPADVSAWAEAPVNTFPQKRFVDISNGKVGLGILNRGLPEYEVLQQGPGVEPGGMAVAVTLLRCVEWLSRGDLSTRHGHAGPAEFTPEAQCLGEQAFDYALVPHGGDWEAEEALVLREAQAFNIPVWASVTGQHEGALSSRTAQIEVEPRELVVSAIKRSNDGEGTIVRVYNPLGHAVEGRILPEFACTRAFVTNLREERRGQIFWGGQDDGAGHPGEALHLGLRAGEIVTILFQ